MDGLLDRSERMARAAIAQWPDGDYSFEEFLDSDGLDGPPQRCAGGGSIVWIDSGGALGVGPKSAGADPVPCVSDAWLSR